MWIKSKNALVRNTKIAGIVLVLAIIISFLLCFYFKDHTFAQEQIFLFNQLGSTRFPKKSPEPPGMRHHTMTGDRGRIGIALECLTNGLGGPTANVLG